MPHMQTDKNPMVKAASARDSKEMISALRRDPTSIWLEVLLRNSYVEIGASHISSERLAALSSLISKKQRLSSTRGFFIGMPKYAQPQSHHASLVHAARVCSSYMASEFGYGSCGNLLLYDSSKKYPSAEGMGGDGLDVMFAARSEVTESTQSSKLKAQICENMRNYSVAPLAAVSEKGIGLLFYSREIERISPIMRKEMLEEKGIDTIVLREMLKDGIQIAAWASDYAILFSEKMKRAALEMVKGLQLV